MSLPFTRLAAPVMRALRWEPELQTVELAALAEQLRDSERYPVNVLDRVKQLERATSELAKNVRSFERASVVHGRLPLTHVDWLRRMWEVLLLAEKSQRGELWARRRVEALDRRGFDRPLSHDQQMAWARAIDPLIDAAEDEHEHLGRRRRLLEAARAMLLDAAASTNLAREAVDARKRHVSLAIVQLDRYQAAGLDARVGLRYQARQAKERGDVRRLHAALTALEEFSLRSGDERLGDLTGKALTQLWNERDRLAPDARAQSLAQSGNETFDQRVQAAITEGYERALAFVPTLKARADAGQLQPANVEVVEQYLAQENLPLLLQAALSVDGCFDVGGVLTPVRVIEEQRFPRFVEYPTQHLVLANAESPRDIPHAIIGDPRMVLLDLASGSLQTRRYVAEEVKRRERTVLKGEVRVYVLDGSGSMLGPRARLRDAILVAELSTLLARLGDPERSVNPTLFYRYFTRTLSPTVCVKTEADALAAISQALSEVRIGGTDIQLALLDSFELVRAAQSDNPDLARAQIVLVTDGDAYVDLDQVQRAREAVGKLPVGVSIIALGEENEALKKLAAQQRARGERVFYQFIADHEIVDFIQGASLGAPVHLPGNARPADLAAAVSELVDEIAANERKTSTEALAQAQQERAALAEVSLTLEEHFSEAEQAKAEAFARDLSSLQRRFERWFPAIQVSSNLDSLTPPEDDLRDLEQLSQLLLTVSEVTELMGGEPLSRMGDAIEIFERLLRDAGMSTTRGLELRQRYPARLQDPYAKVRLSVLGGGPARPS
ncbi:MAG TPA: vWA domain-containing protein [Polyangiaceae bacterium]|nr:vWA domain-containing protein [Polyangiaceae bacterium]